MESVNITRRNKTRLSNWVSVVSKEVEFAKDKKPEIYHCFSQSDYVAILARTHKGLFPIIQQYRPAVEGYTWELPSGILDVGEEPEDTCKRELKEEAGLEVESIIHLGSYYADTGRLENRIHTFFVQASDPDPKFTPEPGLCLDFVNTKTLRKYILSGKFNHQLHLGVFTLAFLRGIISDL